MLEVVSVADTKFNKSAYAFIPDNIYAPYLYAIKFARTCGASENFCYVVPVNFPGVPLSKHSFLALLYLLLPCPSL